MGAPRRTTLALALIGLLLLGPVDWSGAASRAGAPEPTAGESNQWLTNGCWVTKRGLPRCGAYLGMAYGGNTDPTLLEQDVGRLGVRRTYFRPDQVRYAVRTARADIAAGRLPWVSFKLPHPWWRMARGRGDRWARGVARQLGTVEGPVWVAFHHEPEGDGRIRNWRRTQQRLGPILRRTSRNLAFTVILTGWHQLHSDGTYSLRRVWPRRTKVDVAGFDVYNAEGMVKNGSTLGPTDMDGDYFAPLSRWAARKGVYWGLAETGYTDAAARRDPDWIDRTHRQLVARDGIAMAYFNSTLNSSASWDLSPPVKEEAFTHAMRGTPRLPLP